MIPKPLKLLKKFLILSRTFQKMATFFNADATFVFRKMFLKSG